MNYAEAAKYDCLTHQRAAELLAAVADLEDGERDPNFGAALKAGALDRAVELVRRAPVSLEQNGEIAGLFPREGDQFVWVTVDLEDLCIASGVETAANWDNWAVPSDLRFYDDGT